MEIQDAHLKIASRYYLKWMGILTSDWKAVSAADLSEPDETAIAMLVERGFVENEIRRTLFSSRTGETLRVQAIVNGRVGDWQEAMVQELCRNHQSWSISEVEEIEGEIPLYRLRLTTVGLALVELGFTEKAWGRDPAPYMMHNPVNGKIQVSILSRETQKSADNPKNPISHLSDVDDRDLFYEIEKENTKPEAERRSNNAIAKEMFGDSFQTHLRRIQRARKKAQDV